MGSTVGNTSASSDIPFTSSPSVSDIVAGKGGIVPPTKSGGRNTNHFASTGFSIDINTAKIDPLLYKTGADCYFNLPPHVWSLPVGWTARLSGGIKPKGTK